MKLEQIAAQLKHLLEALCQQVLVLLPSKADELLDGSSITLACVVVVNLLPCLRLVLHAATSASPKGSLQAAQHSLARETSAIAGAVKQVLKLSCEEQTEHAIETAGLGLLLAQHPECKPLLTKLCNSQRKTLEFLLPFMK